jgi:hypothetical protein
MSFHALRFMLFVGVTCLACGGKAEEQASLVGDSVVASGPAKISVESQPTSVPSYCALAFSEGEWRISKAQAKQLRQSPWSLGATVSLHSLGVKLDTLDQESLVACVGLRAGDILASVGAVSLMSPLEALPRLEAALSIGGLWTLRYWRGASLQKLKLRIIE